MCLNKLLKYGKYLPFINSINNINSMENKSLIKGIKSKYDSQKIFSYIDKNKSLEILKYNKYFQKQLNINKDSYNNIDADIRSNILTENGIKRLVYASSDDKKDKIEILNIKKEKDKYGIEYSNFSLSIPIDIITENKFFLHTYSYLTELKILYFPDDISKYQLCFSNFKNLKIIELSYCVKSSVKSLKNLFANCFNLELVNLKKFNTSNIQDMSGMFEGCVSLKEIKGLENIKTSNVTDMNNMFAGCHNLTTINLSNFNTEKVNNMSRMFYECINLKNLNLSSFNISNVKDMSYMFSKCENLKNIENIENIYISNLKDKNLDNLKCIFEYCNLDLTNFISSILKEYNPNNDKSIENIKNILLGINLLNYFNQNAPFSLEYHNLYLLYDSDFISHEELLNLDMQNNSLDNSNCRYESENEDSYTYE